MLKSMIAATAILGLASGTCLAQSSSTTTTQSTTSVPAPLGGTVVDSVTQRTVDANGVVIDRTKTYTSGTAITPSGDTATTRKTTETTTVR